jgi:hypothetical protein
MGVPTVTLNVLDGGLSQNLPQNGNTLYVIGPASQGPYWQVITSTNPQDFVTQNGYGSGVELAAFVANGSGTPVAFCAVPTTGATNTAVVSNTTNGSTSAVTLTGSPFDNYYGKVTVLTGGTIGATGIQLGISLDANRTTYQTSNLLAATTLAITNTGLTLNFGAGSLATGDSYTWISTEGVWTDASIQSAVNALIPLPALVPEDIMVAGGSATRTGGASTAGAGTVGATAADVTAFDGYMSTLFNKRRYNRLLCAAGDAAWGGASTETDAVWSASLQTAFAASSSLRVGVTAGHYNAISPISQTQFRRPLLWQAAARDAAVAIQVDLGRVKDGALANMPLPSQKDGYIYHDESVNPGLDAARFLTAYSLAGKPGLFVTNPNLMAPPGSDFNWLQHGHVMDAACLLALQFFVNELGDSVRVNASNGTILPQDAQHIQQQMQYILYSQLVTTNAASATSVVVNTNNNILTTAQLVVTISIVPLGYIKSVALTLTFLNPAVQVVQPTLGGV